MTTKRLPFKAPFGDLQLPPTVRRALAANVDTYKGRQLGQPTLSSDAAYGYAKDMDGATPNLCSLGVAERDQSSSSANGGAEEILWTEWISGYPSSTNAGDSLGDADVGVVAWNAGVGVVGKLSNWNGSNRSILGLSFGLDEEGTPTPWVWYGPVAWCVARGVHLADQHATNHKTAADGAANTATAETQIVRQGVHGHVVGITMNWDAAVAADAANNATLTVYKRDANGANQTVLGTLTTNNAGLGGADSTAFKPVAFTLSAVAGALDVLETDIFTFAITKGGTGVQLGSGVIRIQTKVQ